MMQDIRAEHTGVPINLRQLDQGDGSALRAEQVSPAGWFNELPLWTRQANGRITKMPLPWPARRDDGGGLGRRTVCRLACGSR